VHPEGSVGVPSGFWVEPAGTRENRGQGGNRARNFPESLNESEKKQWQEHCRRRLLGELPGAGVSLAEFWRLLSGGEISMPQVLRQNLVAYAGELAASCGLADNDAKTPALSS